MKKFLALLLAAMMLLSCTAALAETAADDSVTVEHATHEFDVKMVVPEGYKMMQDRIGDLMIISIEEPSDTTPDYLITIAYSEEYDGRTLNELSDDEKTALQDTMDDGFEQAEMQDLTTEAGTEVYIQNEVSPEAEGGYFANAFTIYKGYFIQVFISKPDFSILNQDDLDLGMKILSDIEFVDQQ